MVTYNSKWGGGLKSWGADVDLTFELDRNSFDQSDDRPSQIAFTKIEGVEISTVRLLGGIMPEPYETMVFGGYYNEAQRRYETKEEAIQGHLQIAAMVAMAPKGKDRGVDPKDEPPAPQTSRFAELLFDEEEKS